MFLVKRKCYTQILHIRSLIVVHLFVSQVHFATPPDNTSSGSNHAFAKPEIHTHSLCTLRSLFTPKLYKKHLHFLYYNFSFSQSLWCWISFQYLLHLSGALQGLSMLLTHRPCMSIWLWLTVYLSIPYFPSYFMDIVSSPPLCSLQLYFCFLFCFVFLFKGQN